MVGKPDATTHRIAPAAAAFELFLANPAGVSTRELPETAELAIGRAAECEVVLDDVGASRRHAVLRVARGVLTIEDLGSANGTLLRGRPIAPRTPTPVLPGESVQIGEYVLVVRPRRASGRPRQVWTADYLEARIGEACTRRHGGELGVLRITVDRDAGIAEAIAAELDDGHLLAKLGPAVFAILVLGGPGAGLVAPIGARIAAAGGRATIAQLVCPRDAASPDDVIAWLHDRRPADGSAPSTVAPSMAAIERQLASITQTSINVLVLGETGVGKDVLATRIHELSDRGAGPFVRINCAALTEPLLESELFGHERGAFTGAAASKPGLLETAAGGTAFLDEIGELPRALQAKLLQALERREVLRVGALKPRAIDVRFVAATNADLEADIAAGRFRADLYYRLAGFTVVIPPLRERPDDILALAEAFIRRTGPPRDRATLSPPVRRALTAYAWPGNVRELRNVIERATALAGGGVVREEHLPLERMRAVVVVPAATAAPVAAIGVAPDDDDGGELALTPEERAERRRILEALTTCAGNQSKTAARLGISRSTLLHRLDAYRIRRPRKRS
jgi:two-component system, NtrC family, response regulator AtoC